MPIDSDKNEENKECAEQALFMRSEEVKLPSNPVKFESRNFSPNSRREYLKDGMTLTLK